VTKEEEKSLVEDPLRKIRPLQEYIKKKVPELLPAPAKSVG